MEKNSDKVKHIISGMEREEIISMRLNIIESFIAIINSIIINNKIGRYIKISIVDEDILIVAVGKNFPQSIDFKERININDSKLLVAMIRVCDEITITITKDSIKTSKVLYFKDVNNNSFEEKELKVQEGNNLSDSIAFKISKGHFKGNIKEIKKSTFKQEFKAYASSTYNEAVCRGLTINLFEDIITGKKGNGKLVNENDISIDDNIKIKIYRMKSEGKGIEVIFNGVKIENTIINKKINWNVKPFKRDGYSSKRLFISLLVEFDDVNLNNIEMINNIISSCYDDIIRKVYKYERWFENEIVNINLEYNRFNMGKILKATGKPCVSEATKIVLDTYLEEIEEEIRSL